MSPNLPTEPVVELMLDKLRTLRFDLNAMAVFEGYTGKSMLKTNTLTDMQATDIRALIWACLVHEDPELSVEAVGRYVNMGNFAYVTGQLSRVWSASVSDEGNGGRPAAKSTAGRSRGMS